VQPYYVRETQNWAVDQEHLRHNQALFQIGEYAVFCLLWHIQDYEAGLVGRCLKCYLARGKIAEAYGQPSQNRCVDCLGTTFEGGYRAIIIRPAIFTDTDESEQVSQRGVVHANDVTIDSTSDFRVRTGDYCFRRNNDRYYLRVPNRITVRTGFSHPYQTAAAIGYNHSRATLEDPASVAYMAPPSDFELASILSMTSRKPIDFSDYETIRGPLIPDDDS
jgi:hypothetical protein